MIKVMIIDDSAVVRETLSNIINSDSEFEVIATASDPLIALKKLENISRNFQCIVITHLPQVAAMADNNYYITKTTTGEKTSTNIQVADKQLKIKEVERLIGGENIGQYSKKHAEEMIAWADDYKKQLN